MDIGRREAKREGGGTVKKIRNMNMVLMDILGDGTPLKRAKLDPDSGAPATEDLTLNHVLTHHLGAFAINNESRIIDAMDVAMKMKLCTSADIALEDAEYKILRDSLKRENMAPLYFPLVMSQIFKTLQENVRLDAEEAKAKKEEEKDQPQRAAKEA